MKKHAKGLWRRVVIGVAVVWVLYGFAANVFIKSGLLEKVASPRPERTRISWENAWTVVPGVVHVRGFALRSHSKGSEWTLTVDRARPTINLLALPFNTLQIVRVSASGVDFQIGPSDPELPPKKKKTKPGMRIRIVSASVEDVRAVTIGDLVLTGPLKVRGGLDTQARGPLQVPRASVESTASTLKLDDEILATNLAIDSRLSIDRHVPGDHKGEGIRPFLVARLGAKGDVADLGFLNSLLKGTKTVEFGGGSGSLDADIRLTRGVIEPESILVTEKATYSVDYLGYQVQGSGSIRGFSAANSVPDEFLFFEFDDFSLAYADDHVPYVAGTGLQLSLRGDGSLSLDGEQGPLDLVVDLPKSEIPDLTVYNRNLKSSGALQIESGSGHITAHVEVLERSGGGQSQVVLEAQGVVISFKDKRVVGDLTATGKIKLVALDGWVFDPSGTKVELKNAGAFIEGDGGADPKSGDDAGGKAGD
ncbi:MAG: hypothetical protein QNL88_15250, partial [Acidobacteriota bacterium]|nr:hypothetical protein [Acidobacteriota bacterium]